MSGISLNNKPFALKFTRPLIARQGASVPLDAYAASALALLETALERGVSDADPPGAIQAWLEVLQLEPASEGDEVLKGLQAGGHSRMSISAFLDKDDLTAIRYDVKEYFESNSNALDYNVRQILGRASIRDYLIARAKNVNNLDSAPSIFNHLVDASGGWKEIYDYVVLRSVRAMIDDRKIEVERDASEQIIKKVQASAVALSAPAFSAKLGAVLDEFVFAAKELALIEGSEATLGPIPEKDRPALIKLMKSSKVPITSTNAPYFISIALANLAGGAAVSAAAPAPAEEVEGDDYAVDYYEEEASAVEYDASSVEAAAQLFFVMVWGDEMGIFEVIDRIAAQTSTSLQLSIRKREVSEDLALYVLDEQFRDVKTGKISRRISRAERQMFYRQVFGAGNAPVTEGMMVNNDFGRLWAVLMTEVARYIGKVEESADGNLVSPQKIAQAIEDLRYNLSVYCSGMAKVAAPVIYREMDFVIRKLLSSEDIVSQLAKGGSHSFMKVVETVRGAQDLNPLRNKGVFGHKILSTAARVNTTALSGESSFSDLISTIEAYIVAESQLGGAIEAAPGSDGRPQISAPGIGAPGSAIPGFGGMPGMPDISAMPGMPGANGAAGANGAGAQGRSNDEWNF